MKIRLTNPTAIPPIDAARARVVFINMPLRESARPNTPPQGPALLAARLREAEAQVSIIDLNAYRIVDDEATHRGLPLGRHLTLDEAQSLIERHFHKHGEPDLIGFSGMITTLRWQEQIARICRKIAPDAFIVSGGGLATELKAGLFSWIPELDAVGHSEGDDIILQIATDAKLRRERGGYKARYTMTDRQSYWGDVNGEPKHLYHGDRPLDLDALPLPAWDLLHADVDGNPILEWYIQTPVWGGTANNSSATPFTMSRSLTTVSSRGCPYACAFCYRGAQGERAYGMRSPQNLAIEAAYNIATYQIDFLGFPDDNFAVDCNRIDQLPAALGPLKIRWGTHTRMDEADKRLKPMAESGCIYIGFGAESASPTTLKRMQKGGFILKRGMHRPPGADREFPTTMVDAIHNCRTYGIHSNCTWIMGYPGETLADLQTSVAFIMWQYDTTTKDLVVGSKDYEVALWSINRKMFTATAYPGTEMFRDPAVRSLLTLNFGIHFDETGEPVCDEALRQYILELDDATKLLHGKDGQPLNYSAMNMDTFLEARRHIDEGHIERILDMT